MMFLLCLLLSPDPPPDADTVTGYLITVLTDAMVYEEPFPEHVMFIVENEDSTTCSGSFDHYFDITLREVHTPETGGDPNTAPVIDRFRVYIDGPILWWSPLPGMYVPWEDFLRGRTDL